MSLGKHVHIYIYRPCSYSEGLLLVVCIGIDNAAVTAELNKETKFCLGFICWTNRINFRSAEIVQLVSEGNFRTTGNSTTGVRSGIR